MRAQFAITPILALRPFTIRRSGDGVRIGEVRRVGGEIRTLKGEWGQLPKLSPSRP